jgi:RimJ/RimL family protein N-acetyltransferase
VSPQVIFETDRLIVRKLQMSDLEPFHTMQSNPKVMRYADGEVKSIEAHEEELNALIELYQKSANEFWIYAIERKQDTEFVGTLALVKDDQQDDEIGFRYLEKYWGLGYGSEIGLGLIDYCRSVNMPKLIGYVIDKNMASAKILQKLGFEAVDRGIEPKTGLPETKYELKL